MWTEREVVGSQHFAISHAAYTAHKWRMLKIEPARLDYLDSHDSTEVLCLFVLVCSDEQDSDALRC